jgi:hypothetical protein
MWGEKMRPHWPTSASFAGGVAGAAQRVISSLDASSVLTAARGASARLVRFSAWRSIVVRVFFVLFSPESFLDFALPEPLLLWLVTAMRYLL